MRKVYDWDSGRYLGEIPEAAETCVHGCPFFICSTPP